MTRTFVSRLLGVLLLMYGLSAVLVSWWAYSITHEAYASVRNFTAVLERERAQAVDAAESATGLLGGSGSAAPGAPPSSGPAPGQGAQGLRERLRGLTGAAPAAQPAPTPQAGAPSAKASDGLGLLDELESKISQVGGGWNRLGEGPLPRGLLGQVEFATNAVLIWLAAHGVASIVIGFFLLERRKRPQPNEVGSPQPWPQ